MRNKFAVVLSIAAGLACFSIPGIAAQDAPAARAPAPGWTIDQVVTCSVHDAWLMGGKTEPGFFEIVKALAELSEQKRDVTLPDNETVGHQFGEYIKAQAKMDHDQLLYSIVDRAVRKYGKPVTKS